MKQLECDFSFIGGVMKHLCAPVLPKGTAKKLCLMRRYQMNGKLIRCAIKNEQRSNGMWLLDILKIYFRASDGAQIYTETQDKEYNRHFWIYRGLIRSRMVNNTNLPRNKCKIYAKKNRIGRKKIHRKDDSAIERKKICSSIIKCESNFLFDSTARKIKIVIFRTIVCHQYFDRFKVRRAIWLRHRHTFAVRYLK